jgi:exodeoxyribonuclease-3
MKIATWNVNSITVRLERLVAWLARHQPDALCLQETKLVDEKFPFAALEDAGYQAAAWGQKTYNGVAILARSPIEEVERGFGDAGLDAQARLLSARVDGVRIFSVYVPNGGEVSSDKWAYKLDWLRHLRAHLDARFKPADPVVLCGDFNVAPDERDVARPAAWADSVLFHPEARKSLQDLLGFGLVDVFRRHCVDGGFYSWWDYRMLAFPKNDGLRIDHVFATPSLAARSVAASIDRQERKGKQPSDHAPVIAEFT